MKRKHVCRANPCLRFRAKQERVIGGGWKACRIDAPPLCDNTLAVEGGIRGNVASIADCLTVTLAHADKTLKERTRSSVR